MITTNVVRSAHDMMIMALHGEHFSLYWHHIVVMLGSGLMMFYKRAVFFPTWFYMSELTVPLQNTIFALQTFAPEHRATLRALIKARFVAFIGMRLLLTPVSVSWTPYFLFD